MAGIGSSVKITFRARGCDTYVFTTVNTTAEKPRVREWKSEPGRGGLTTLSVPAPMTKDMAFEVAHPSGLGLSHNRPDLVIAYPGTKAGDTVDEARASKHRNRNRAFG